MSIHVRPSGKRHGAAVLELAVLLPLLLYMFAIGVDFARVFYYSQIITNCARNGAVYGAYDDANAANQTGIEGAALADASNLQPQPTVTSAVGTDTSGDPCVTVTVSWNFASVSRFPGIPATVTLTRKVQMRIAPTNPQNS